MKQDKYSNGMYKTTSKAQDMSSMNLFKAFTDNGLLDYMNVDFNQTSGECEYTYTFKNSNSVYYVLINRNGMIIQSGFTTR